MSTPSIREHWLQPLTEFLQHLNQISTPTPIILTLQYKLSITLDIPYSPPPQRLNAFSSGISPLLLDAIRHQNIIRWDTSVFWKTLYYSLFHDDHSHPRPDWDTRLVALARDLYQKIWHRRNTHIHGHSKKVANEKLRLRIQQEVRLLYDSPPVLHKRYPCITSTPYQNIYLEAHQA